MGQVSVPLPVGDETGETLEAPGPDRLTARTRTPQTPAPPRRGSGCRLRRPARSPPRTPPATGRDRRGRVPPRRRSGTRPGPTVHGLTGRTCRARRARRRGRRRRPGRAPRQRGPGQRRGDHRRAGRRRGAGVPESGSGTGRPGTWRCRRAPPTRRRRPGDRRCAAPARPTTSVLEPPRVGCRVRHRRPHLGGERLVLVDDVGELDRPLRRLGPQPAVGVQLQCGGEARREMRRRRPCPPVRGPQLVDAGLDGPGPSRSAGVRSRGSASSAISVNQVACRSQRRRCRPDGRHAAERSRASGSGWAGSSLGDDERSVDEPAHAVEGVTTVDHAVEVRAQRRTGERRRARRTRCARCRRGAPRTRR